MANKDIEIRPDRRTGLNTEGVANKNLDQTIQKFLSDPFGSWLFEFPTLTRNALGNIKETDEASFSVAGFSGPQRFRKIIRA